MGTSFISVLIPCRNEEKFIKNTLESIINQDYNLDFVEIIIIDGESTDGTIKIISEFQTKYSNIVLLNNPKKIVPTALNIGIEKAKGDVIIRMDAHCMYPKNYISGLVKMLFELNADNVGGIWITLPGSNTLIAKSIALATSSKFGIGNAQYRLSNENISEVDTVPFGCYKKQVFNKIGMFDEDLVRNQDDEFNARLVKNGGKIFLIPNIKIEYYARPTLSKMFKMFYQYGIFKPLVAKKVGKPATIRQFFPPAFVLYCFMLCIVLVASNFQLFLYFSVFIIFYFLISILFSLRIALENKRFELTFLLPIVYSAIHFSYGIGYLKGILNLVFNIKRSKEVNISR